MQNESGFVLQNATALLQNVTVITNCEYFITKCDVYENLRHDTGWMHFSLNSNKKNAYAEEQIVSVAKSGKYQIADYECQTIAAQPVITCSKLTIETLEQSVKYVKS